MILRCTFEELSAVKAAAARVIGGAGSGGIAAPPDVIADVEALLGRMDGDVSVRTLADVRGIARTTEFILEETRSRTDDFILAQHPAAEDAVTSYFEYAYILTFMDRVRRLDAEMCALIELMTGEAPTDDAAVRVSFDD